MKASELVQKHIDAAKNHKTVYMWGVFGAPVTESLIREKSAQYPSWYTAQRQAAFRALIAYGGGEWPLVRWPVATVRPEWPP